MAEDSQRKSGKWSGLSSTWFWVSQITSIIGLISIVDDLRLWVSAMAWLGARLAQILPLLGRLFTAVASAIDAVLDIFRGVFRPIVDFCLQWLPFQVPEIVKDGLVVAIFVSLGLLRTNIKYFMEWDKETQAYYDLVRKFATEYNIICNKNHACSLGKALEAYVYLRSETKLRFGSNYDRDIKQGHWDQGLTLFGPKLEVMAAERAHEGVRSQRLKTNFERERRARKLVWLTGGCTGVLVLIDILFFR